MENFTTTKVRTRRLVTILSRVPLDSFKNAATTYVYFYRLGVATISTDVTGSVSSIRRRPLWVSRDTVRTFIGVSVVPRGLSRWWNSVVGVFGNLQTQSCDLIRRQTDNTCRDLPVGTFWVIWSVDQVVLNKIIQVTQYLPLLVFTL